MSATTAPQMNYAKAATKFASVSIPDLRNQQIEMIREEKEAGFPPLATVDEEQLKKIQNDIRQNYENAATTTRNDDELFGWLANMDAAELSQLEPLVDSVLKQYPAGGTPLISIASSENNPQLAATTGRAAWILQGRSLGKVLLIDSDLDNGGLTYHLQCVGRLGLVELVSGKSSWEECVIPSLVDNLDFISIGRSQLRKETSIESWIGKNLRQFKQDYDYVVVCAGDAHSTHGAQWCSNSSGAYLLVSMSNSNQVVAKSAVTHLRNHGSKLLGCIASDLK